MSELLIKDIDARWSRIEFSEFKTLWSTWWDKLGNCVYDMADGDCSKENRYPLESQWYAVCISLEEAQTLLKLIHDGHPMFEARSNRPVHVSISLRMLNGWVLASTSSPKLSPVGSTLSSRYQSNLEETDQSKCLTLKYPDYILIVFMMQSPWLYLATSFLIMTQCLITANSICCCFALSS
eukprot:TRINITY_DN5681_c0_g1_i1.p1 TRINITY_DN5681_c0_g1~~TRINITY_DN5681_c0_g1_i1.p1  ORF type:complete len:181 (-),score=8.02 TRINITY_DN5681_c0_g1_i1:29-571(-)